MVLAFRALVLEIVALFLKKPATAAEAAPRPVSAALRRPGDAVAP
jgi:hypothetical protein